MVTNSGKEGELSQEEEYILSNPYHLLGVFSSQVKNSPIYEMEKHCNIEIAAQITRLSSAQSDGDRDHFHIEGLMESPATDDEGECFSPLLLNATSVNIEVYYNKAVNYTLDGHLYIIPSGSFVDSANGTRQHSIRSCQSFNI
ncbi:TRANSMEMBRANE E3 UBIQUITIN-PROTEIN LIGASE 1-LIKE [Salix purpurea]|uniref:TRANSMEMBRANE E3 UBIQUITIN-PROTEIN LIGASE 1-LIKE n=1 Tax=Salix purpurea TaxID=77065 RepID=A0A9Q0UQD6_SALPP|nr:TRANSMEMBRANE E3 UBIQUITIN-PROTEIN LIGASE 1-LIKE [Salix purpurea]